MATQIGQVLAEHPKSTVSPLPCDPSQIDRLLDRPLQTQAECEQLRALPLALPSEHIPATPAQIADKLQWIRATLPMQNADEENGQRRFVVYARLLSGYSVEALSFLVERACKELDWFPSPKQCLAILDRYSPAPSRKDRALRKCEDFTQAMFDQFVADLRDGPIPQEQIDAAPERWKRICVETGLLRWQKDKFIQRIRPPIDA